MATAAQSQEGGAGGKFPRRLLRRLVKPYDRPHTGRHALPNPVSPATRTRWLPKFVVDGASRISTRLFSSVFTKGLPAPATNSEPPPEFRDESPNEVSNNPLSGPQERGCSEGGRPSNSSENNGLDELEQLLKQKTFTRVEFDHLTELLRSRTVDLSSNDENRSFKLNTLEPAATQINEHPNVPLQENGTNVWSNSFPESISTPAVRSSVPEAVASATEIAKAYMGTVSSRVSPSPLGLRNQPFREDVPLLNNVPYAPKSPNLTLREDVPFLNNIPYAPKFPNSSLTPRSAVRFSAVPRLAEDGYLTPKSQRGKSVIYNKARSPYSRPVQFTANPEGTSDGYAGLSTPSQWPPAKRLLFDGRQALKRRSSFLDDDFGSIGPIRRIRQKSNMMDRKKSIIMSPISSDGGQSSSKPHQLEGSKYNTLSLKAAENGENGIGNTSLASIPSQSSEMARKILEQLDKMVPSPHDKSTVSKLAIAREKSPAKLTLNMLNGRARRSMEDIDSPKFDIAQGGVLDGQNGGSFLSPASYIAREKDEVEENGPSMVADGGKMSSKADGTGNAILAITDTPFGAKAAESVSLGLTANPPQETRRFQMTAPEGPLEDDEGYGSKTPDPNDKRESPGTEGKANVPETLTVNKPLVSFSETRPAVSSTLRPGVVTRASSGFSFVEDSRGFTFPVTSASEALSEPPPTPTPLPSPLLGMQVQSMEQTMPSPLFGMPAQSKEQATTPLFSFGFSSSSAIVVSSSTSAIETPGFKFGAESDSKAERKASEATASVNVPSTPSASPLVTTETRPASPPAVTPAATPLAIPASDKVKQTQKSDDSLKPSQNAPPSLSTPAFPSIFSGFSASTMSTLENGSVTPTSSTVSLSIAPAAPVSSTSPTSIFGGNSSSNSAPISAAATAPTFSAASLFQFPSGTLAAPSSVNPVSPPLTTSGHEPSNFVEKVLPNKSSPFGTINSSFSAISSGQFASTGSGIFGFSTPAVSNTTNASSATTNTSTSNQSQSSASPFGAITGSLFASQTSPTDTSVSSFTQSMPSQFGSSSSSPSFGLSGSPISGSSASPFGSSMSGSKAFDSNSVFGTTSAMSCSTGSGTGSFGTSSNPFSSNSQGTSSNPFTSNSQGTSSNPFSSNSPASAPSFFGTGFGSSSSPVMATGFSFGGPSAAGSVPFSFGASLSASSGPAFSFTSAASAPTPSSPASVSFVAAAPGNDQMIEDSMAEDTVQASAPVVSQFGMPASLSAPSNFVFGSPSGAAGGSSLFQFGVNQNPAAPQTQFTAAGNLEFNGGSFSLGSGGGDKSNRRIVKIRRDKVRRK